MPEPIESLVSEEKAHTNGEGSLGGALGAVYSAISDLNLQLPKEGRVEKSLDTVLFGSGGKLDSLTLANFIVIAEHKLEESFGFRVDLTQDDPFSPASGHFRTVRSLANYISALVQGKSRGVLR